MNRDVHLLVQGALLERLLEKALAEGAVFARIRRIDDRSMRIETDVRSADTLIRLCRRYSLNCRTLVAPPFGIWRAGDGQSCPARRFAS